MTQIGPNGPDFRFSLSKKACFLPFQAADYPAGDAESLSEMVPFQLPGKVFPKPIVGKPGGVAQLVRARDS